MAQSAEQTKKYQIVKAFRGLNTKANRTAIDDQEFSWLENAQPLGSGNIKITAAAKRSVNDASANVAWSNTIVDLRSGFVGTDNLIFGFQSNGACQSFNVSSNAVATVAAAGTFTGSSNRLAQWKNELVLISDPNKGLFVYDGNVTVKLGSVGVIGLKNVGSGYTTIPAVTISAPNQAGGVQAVAEASISGGAISSITLTEPGTGYTDSPTVTITGGGGTAGQAVASFVTFATGTVYAAIESGGTGYTNAANISVGFSGARAQTLPLRPLSAMA